MNDPDVSIDPSAPVDQRADGSLPSVTVVIGSKDRPALVRRCVRALLAQRDALVQVVVVDDGSQPPLAAALDDLLTAASDRLQVLRSEPSTGVATARQRGLDTVTTPWVGFCDDDDLWAPTKAAEQVQAAERAGAAWSCSAAVTVDEDLRVGYLLKAPEPAEVRQRLRETNPIPGGASCVIARTDLVRQVGGWDPTLSTLADWDLWIRLALASPLAVVDRPLTAYLLNSSGMSLDTDLFQRDLERLVEKRREARSGEVVLDHWRWLDYISYVELRNGDRRAAARASLRSFRQGAPRRRVAGAVLAVVSPRFALWRRHRRMCRKSSQAALTAATEWIDASRDG